MLVQWCTDADNAGQTLEQHFDHCLFLDRKGFDWTALSQPQVKKFCKYTDNSEKRVRYGKKILFFGPKSLELCLNCVKN